MIGVIYGFCTYLFDRRTVVLNRRGLPELPCPTDGAAVFAKRRGGRPAPTVSGASLAGSGTSSPALLDALVVGLGGAIRAALCWSISSSSSTKEVTKATYFRPLGHAAGSLNFTPPCLPSFSSWLALYEPPASHPLLACAWA